MDIELRERVILKVPSGFSDGETQYREIPGAALKLENYTKTANGVEVNDETVFLIKAEEMPCPGWIVVDSAGVERELHSVKVCRSLDGDVAAFRCKV